MTIEIKAKLQKEKMIEFLRKNVPRMNRIKAESVINLLEDNSLELLIQDNKYLSGIKGISEKSVLKVQECLQIYTGLKEVFELVNELDDREDIISAIYKGIGSNAVAKVRENPYCICDKCDVDFSIADKIAVSLEFEFDNKSRIKQGIMCVIDNEIKKNGDLFSYRIKIIKELFIFLNKASGFNNNYDDINNRVDMAFNSLIVDGEIVIEENIHKEVCIYRRGYYDIEKGIVDRVESRLSKGGFCNSKETVLKHESLKNYRINNEQWNALSTSLSNKISIITGGPGTGKTWIITMIVSAIHSINPNADVQISAPTGKAAIRVGTVTGQKAMTIHRLLNLSVGDRKKDKVNMVQSTFLIVDEASMVDAYLCYELLINTDSKTNIIIVGDHEQLPSVGPGSILKDLISSNRVPVVTLKQVYRQSEMSLIVKNANILVDKEKIGKEKWLEFDEEQFVFIEEIEEKVIDKMLLIINNLIFQSKYTLDEIMVLSHVKKGDLGVDNLNLRLQKWYHEEDTIGIKGRIMNSDKVIQNINNYHLGVMNGEVGIVKSLGRADDGYLHNVNFGGLELQYDDDIIEQLDLAYAITIHKSQGSEYPVIIIPISKQNMYRATMNSIYTAITRAKKKVILIGDKSVFFEAVNKREQNIRNSRIIEKLNS